ncbi:MAG: hypothetical protein QMD22_11655 [archaeon]|nr:hypothetical protein [archaeon]
MIKDEEVRPEGGIYELCSDISPNWKDIRTNFGYTTLSEIGGKRFKRTMIWCIQKYTKDW